MVPETARAWASAECRPAACSLATSDALACPQALIAERDASSIARWSADQGKAVVVVRDAPGRGFDPFQVVAEVEGSRAHGPTGKQVVQD